MDKFYMLGSKKFKARRNQMLHQIDENGVTYCQTENVKRSKTKLAFIEVTDVTGRPVCKSCRAIKKEQENPMKASVDSLTTAFMATIG